MEAYKKPTSLFAELAQKYGYLADALALFSLPSSPSHAEVEALRVQVRVINKEFADNTLFGKNRKGNFYYNDTESLDKATCYNLKHVKNPSDEKICVWVRFSEVEGGEITAEFLGYDPEGTVGDLDYSHSGKWSALTFGNSVEASVQEGEDVDTLILDASQSIGYEAKLALLPSASPAGALSKAETTLLVAGRIYFKNYTSIRTTSLADLDNNRMILYAGEASEKKCTGFFIPSKSFNEAGKFPILRQLRTVWLSVTEIS